MKKTSKTNSIVKAKFEKKSIPTYLPGQHTDLPMFFEKKPYQGATGKVYPIPYTDSLSENKKNIEYDAAVLENEYLEVIILPQIGGKIYRAYDKIGNYDFVYYNSVIKPAMIGLAGPWISGGIEFNWPQHHRPTTFLPTESKIEELANGEKTVWVGEVEPLYRTKGMAGITICPGRSYIKVKVRLYNRTPFVQPFMWWANLAVPVNNNYSVIFPPDVEWVNDHDRRAVISWPIAKGIYETARPFNYGDGTDISKYSSVKVPSSFFVSEGQSDYEFVAGYDHGKKMGVVTCADHSIAPGKKLFHWGTGDFGDMWCSNLTDEDGPYVELMTGVYSDNQPDFSWIYPYETKTFEQYWYPIRNIGGVKNATIDAAVNMEQYGSELFFGFQPTGEFPNCQVKLFHHNCLVWSDVVDMDPANPYTKRIPMEAGWNIEDLTIALYNSEGKELVSYKQPELGKRKPIEPRKLPLRPSEYKTNEELFINGLHLEQYKHHTYDPRDYYSEALRRDPDDIRCNIAMGRLCLYNADFNKCIDYLDRAIARMTSRNNHPSNVEAFYLKGLALKYLGRIKESADMFSKAIWHYEYRSAAYYELAQINAINGFYTEALQKLDLSLSTNTEHLKALNLKAAILRNIGHGQEAYDIASKTVRLDPLDLWAHTEMLLAASQSGKTDLSKELQKEINTIFKDKPEDYLDIVCEYINSGLYNDAITLLEKVDTKYPLVQYYLAYCNSLTGNNPKSYLQEAERCEGICFPSRLDDIKVLTFATESYENPSRAHYYLGCLFYDRFQYDKALENWEAAIRIDPSFAYAYRNLALVYFDKYRDYRSARICMEYAIKIKPEHARLLYELQQLYKNSGVSPRERLDIYENNIELTKMRDDCYLDYVILHSLIGKHDTAIELAKKRRFHIYEGGEGKLTYHHAWFHVLYGNQLVQKGALEEAESVYRKGFIIPREYGEAKSYFAQEAHINYFLAKLLERTGRVKEAQDVYEAGTEYKATVSELSLFRALSMQKLMRFSEARQVLDEMIETSNRILNNTDLYAYFGVGSRIPMPFEYDIEKINHVEGYIIKAYALLGYDKVNEAKRTIDMARALDPYDYRIYTFDQIIYEI